MDKLSLTVPGFSPIPQPSGLKADFVDLGSFISPLLNIAFYAAGFLAFFFLVWGAFAYILARGEKEGLAKARAKITWAIIGFMVIILAFIIAKYFSEIFPPKGGLPF